MSKLRSITTVEEQYRADNIATLKALLARVENGEVAGMHIAVEGSDGVTLEYVSGPVLDLRTTLGSLEYLKARVLQRMLGMKP